MICRDMPFVSRGWVFGVKLSPEDTAEIECLRDVATATNFGTKWICVTDSDLAMAYGGGLSSQPTECKMQICRRRCHGNSFWDYISYKWPITTDNDMGISCK